MLSKGISQVGIEAVGSMLALLPEQRIAAKEALGLEWLRPDGDGEVRLETMEDSVSLALPEGLAPPRLLTANGDSPRGNGEVGFGDRVAMAVDVNGQRAAEDLLPGHRLQGGALSEGNDPIDGVGYSHHLIFYQ